MKKTIIGALVAATALLSGCDTEQAKPTCIIGAGDYAVKFIPKAGATNTCPASPGELFGATRFPSHEGAAPKLSFRTGGEALVGPESFPTLIADNEAANPDWVDAWLGSFSADYDLSEALTIGTGTFPESDAPDADGFCPVSDIALSAQAHDAQFVKFEAASFEQDDGEWVVSDDAVPETVLTSQTVDYAFTNTKFYVSARSPGVTFAADVKITSTIVGSADAALTSCTAEYSAVGLWPAAGCQVDEDCNSCPYDVDGAYTAGSGINPDIKTSCQPISIHGSFCVVDGDELPGFASNDELSANSAECKRRAQLSSGQ